MVIYLDNNATTKVDDRVFELMLPYLKNEYANPSSMYEFSVNASNAIAEARNKVKDFLGASSDKNIIFTVFRYLGRVSFCNFKIFCPV